MSSTILKFNFQENFDFQFNLFCSEQLLLSGNTNLIIDKAIREDEEETCYRRRFRALVLWTSLQQSFSFLSSEELSWMCWMCWRNRRKRARCRMYNDEIIMKLSSVNFRNNIAVCCWLLLLPVMFCSLLRQLSPVSWESIFF